MSARKSAVRSAGILLYRMTAAPPAQPQKVEPPTAEQQPVEPPKVEPHTVEPHTVEPHTPATRTSGAQLPAAQGAQQTPGFRAVEVWIAHMGGPFWARKDAGAWSIPKGELDGDENELAAALREFHEEIGAPAPDVPYERLGDVVQSSGKVVIAFAGRADFAIEKVRSNTFRLEWPKGSGSIREFPEIDDARWFTVEEARRKLVRGQLPLLDRLEAMLARSKTIPGG